MQVYLLVTEKCNLSCPMCIRGDQDGAVLSIQKLYEIIKRGDFKNCDLILTGGEPTLHPEFCKIIDIVCAAARSVTITSNGTTACYLDTARQHENIHVQISIDGDQPAHDFMRGAGTYAQAMETVQELEHAGISYSVATVVSRKNFSFLDGLCSELEQLKNLRFWKLSYEMPFKNRLFDEMMTSTEWNTFVDGMIQRARLRLRVKKIFPFELYQKYCTPERCLPHETTRCVNCGSGSQKIYVYPDLKVYPCTCLTDFCVGNLEETTLNHILHGEKLSSFLNYKVGSDTVCSTCEYRVVCNGGCIGMSYHYFGKLGQGDIRCSKLGVLK